MIGNQSVVISTLGNSLGFDYEFKRHKQEVSQVKLVLQKYTKLSFA